MADFPSTLAPHPLGWNADQEKQFQTYMAFDPNVRAWRNGFQTKYGEPPNTTSDPSFNYRAAFAANDGPRDYSNDTIPHWGSAGKMPNHPTEWMQQFWDQFGGRDPTTLPAAQWTPQMQDFMRGPIGEQQFQYLPPQGLF